MTRMSMGGNIALSAAAVRASLRWTGGPGIPDVDASALLLEETGKVGSESDFVFYNQPAHVSGAVRMAGKTPGPSAADQVDVDLARVPASTTRVVLAASADGGTFGQVPELRMVLLDLGDGRPIAEFAMHAEAETAFVTAELYRRDGAWKFRAIGQGYASGLAGLAADFGIDTGEAAAAPPPAEPPPSPVEPPPAPLPVTNPYPPAPEGFAPPAPAGYAPVAPAHEPPPR